MQTMARETHGRDEGQPRVKTRSAVDATWTRLAGHAESVTEIQSGSQWPSEIVDAYHVFIVFTAQHQTGSSLDPASSAFKPSSIRLKRLTISELRGITMQFEVLAKCHTTRARVSKMRLART